VFARRRDGVERRQEGIAIDRKQLRRKLGEYVAATYELEDTVLGALDDLPLDIADPLLGHSIDRHRVETLEHAARLAACLDQLGRGAPSLHRRQSHASEEPVGRRLRELYVLEHREIAAYEVLRRIARDTGDDATADAADLNLADERVMVRSLESRWGSVLRVTLDDWLLEDEAPPMPARAMGEAHVTHSPFGQ
jgi:ferritin-like metal-binding protein YciE